MPIAAIKSVLDETLKGIASSGRSKFKPAALQGEILGTTKKNTPERARLEEELKFSGVQEDLEASDILGETLNSDDVLNLGKVRQITSPESEEFLLRINNLYGRAENARRQGELLPPSHADEKTALLNKATELSAQAAELDRQLRVVEARFGRVPRVSFGDEVSAQNYYLNELPIVTPTARNPDANYRETVYTFSDELQPDGRFPDRPHPELGPSRDYLFHTRTYRQDLNGNNSHVVLELQSDLQQKIRQMGGLGREGLTKLRSNMEHFQNPDNSGTPLGSKILEQHILPDTGELVMGVEHPNSPGLIVEPRDVFFRLLTSSEPTQILLDDLMVLAQSGYLKEVGVPKSIISSFEKLPFDPAGASPVFSGPPRKETLAAFKSAKKLRKIIGTSPEDMPPESPFQSTWSKKALEREMARTVNEGFDQLAVPVKFTDKRVFRHLARDEKLQDTFYGKQVVKDMRNIAKEIGGEFKFVDEVIPGSKAADPGMHPRAAMGYRQSLNELANNHALDVFNPSGKIIEHVDVNSAAWKDVVSRYEMAKQVAKVSDESFTSLPNKAEDMTIEDFHDFETVLGDGAFTHQESWIKFNENSTPGYLDIMLSSTDRTMVAEKGIPASLERERWLDRIETDLASLGTDLEGITGFDEDAVLIMDIDELNAEVMTLLQGWKDDLKARAPDLRREANPEDSTTTFATITPPKDKDIVFNLYTRPETVGGAVFLGQDVLFDSSGDKESHFNPDNMEVIGDVPNGDDFDPSRFEEI